LAGVSSTNSAGGNQVDGLPPAPVKTQQKVQQFINNIVFLCSCLLTYM